MSEDLQATQGLCGAVVFVDADVFLHYPPLNELPWDTLCPGVRPTVAVCLTVVGQVDSKKNDPRLRERALRAVSDIRRFRSQGHVREGLQFRIYHDAVRDEDIPSPLMPHCVDDRILTAVLRVGKDNPQCEPRFMSGDCVVEIKCQSLGIPFVSLEKVDRLSPPADEHTKKLKALEMQVATLQARIPGLHLEAECLGRLGVSAQVKPCHADSGEREEWLNEVVAKEVQETTGGHERLQQMEPGRRAEWERYFNEFRTHCSQMAQKAEICRQTFVCRLTLANRGTAPATHVGARIAFPGKVRVFGKESKAGQFLTSTHEPPKKPVASQSYPMRYSSAPRDFSSVIDGIRIQQRDERVPVCAVKERATAEGTDEIEIRLGRLQQEEQVACCEVLVVFVAGEVVTPLELKCVLTASEIPNAVRKTVGLMLTGTEDDYPGLSK